MGLGMLGKNTMLNASGITQLGLYTEGAGKACTGVASTGVLASTAHGFSVGDMIVFTALTGGTGTGGAGLLVLIPYFVKTVPDADHFTLSGTATSGTPGAQQTFAVDVSATTTAKKLTELTGGSPAYARKGVTYAAAALGSMDITSTVTFDIPAGGVIDWIAALSSGGNVLHASKVTQEVFASQGTAPVTSAVINLNA